MNSDEIAKKDLRVGMKVDINPQSDRTRKIIVSGNISEILTNAASHPHGILVLLESGEKGRVKSITNNQKKSSTSNNITLDNNAFSSLKELIDEGENHNIEFKSSALWSSKLTADDIKNYQPQSKELHTYGKITSKVIIAKTIAAFLNTSGGTLVIGVKENKNGQKDEIIGVEPDFEFIKDKDQDGYRRMIVDLIKDYFPSNIFNHFDQYIRINFETISQQTICGITALKSDQKVFLNIKNKDHFYIRTGASSRELLGEGIVDYCDKRFS